MKDSDWDGKDSGGNPPRKETTVNNETTTQKGIQIGRSMLVCKFFLSKNGCRNGMKCSFMHMAKESIYKGKICKFHLRGHCNKGDNCNFQHPTDVRTQVEKKDGANKPQSEAEEVPERVLAHSRILQQKRDAEKATERWTTPKREDKLWSEKEVDMEDLPEE